MAPSASVQMALQESLRFVVSSPAFPGRTCAQEVLAGTGGTDVQVNKHLGLGRDRTRSFSRGMDVGRMPVPGGLEVAVLSALGHPAGM